jgi:hypothetical protein
MASIVPQSASRLSAAACFWLFPLVCGAAYVAATNDYAARPNRHGFEQGILGLGIGIGMVAAICTVSLLGFLLAQLVLSRISFTMSLSFHSYILSGAAGITALIGFQIVGWLGREIVSTSDLFWLVYFVSGQVALAFITSTIILLGGYWFGFIHRP